VRDFLSNFAALASCDDVSTVDESEKLVSSGRANELIAATELAVATSRKLRPFQGLSAFSTWTALSSEFIARDDALDVSIRFAAGIRLSHVGGH
jgi:hypothetical protein